MHENFHKYFPKTPHWQQRLQNQYIQEVSLLRWLKMGRTGSWICQLLRCIVCAMVSVVNLMKFRITWQADFWDICETLSSSFLNIAQARSTCLQMIPPRSQSTGLPILIFGPSHINHQSRQPLTDLTSGHTYLGNSSAVFSPPRWP